MGLSEEEVFAKMDHDVDVMIEAVQFGKQKDQKVYERSHRRRRLQNGCIQHRNQGRPFRQYCEPRHDAGPFRIRLQRFHGAHRATPTPAAAASCLAVLLTLMEDKGMDRKDVVMSMFTAAASEWSSPRTPASPAPKAAARQNAAARRHDGRCMVELSGGTPSQCADACAVAIANQLGLVCDPVAGLVEFPA